MPTRLRPWSSAGVGLGIASRGTQLALLRWPAGASSGLLTP